MSRKLRQHTFTGIYHVMLRGINKQNIFFCEDDYVRMMEILRDAPFKKNEMTNEVLSDRLCTIYAYCILDNHVHILIREGEMGISDLMQSIEIKYAKSYNIRYERVGHLFQGRFESETVDDSEYFYTLLRYIHRNPVKAMEANTPEEYPYSSWNEYTNHPSNILQVLKPSAIQTVLRKYPLPELTEWVNTNVDDNCLDMNRFPNPLSDREAFEILSEISGFKNPEDFRLLDPPTQIYFLLQAIQRGVSLRQASRLGTITYHLIRKAHRKKQGDSLNRGTGYSGCEKQGDTPPPNQGDSLDHGTGYSGCAMEAKTKEIPLTPLAALKRAFQIIEDREKKEKETKLQQELSQTLAQAKEIINHIEGISQKTYHRMHLIVEYLSQHPDSKCQDIADHIQAGLERTRIILVQLFNANVIDIQGNARARSYTLHTPRGK